MSVGYAVNKNEVDASAGNMSRQIEGWTDQVLSMKQYLDATTDEKLEELGYQPEDIAVLKSAYNDLALLANAFRGDAEITPARDLGVFSRRMAGLIL